MIAGRLKETIIFLRLVEEKGEYGDIYIKEIEEIKTKASLHYTHGERGVINNEIVNTYSVKFEVRSYHNINEKMIIRWKDKDYRILSIDNITDKSKITIDAELIND